ncbi:IQ domain-containing protein K [Anabrus simplex]|uniref:IQ domain-containing protein K n=1 Tax=Anabrus simplex TaxID=316456 RepID=UPI0035A2C197
MQYLDRQIMPLLLPAIEDTLQQAIKWECLQLQKCRFNGIDNIVENLWNKNPIYPQRAENWTTLYEIPMVKTSLALKPRPIFPKSWIWTRDEAASVIQAAVRSFLLRCQPEVQEMRQFWKAMRQIAAEERRQKKEEEERLAEEEKKIQNIKEKERQEVTSYITDNLLTNAMNIVEDKRTVNAEYFEPYLMDLFPFDYDSTLHSEEQTIQMTDLDQDENKN